jgi:hypothetical protein
LANRLRKLPGEAQIDRVSPVHLAGLIKLAIGGSQQQTNISGSAVDNINGRL